MKQLYQYYTNNPKKFEKLPKKESIFHSFDPKNPRTFVVQTGYKKYIDKASGQLEIVIDPNGNFAQPTNQGTYNYYPPDNYLSHFFLDVLPYWMTGNNADDKTTGSQRFLRLGCLIQNICE